MNEILLNIISVVVTAVVLPLISIAGTKLVKLINSKIKDSEEAKLLSTATEIVTAAVKSVFQTYVESLKTSGTFNEEAQKTALSKAKESALTQMSEDVKTYISDTYGDLNTWLTTEIESIINTLKN
ncbi:MAG: hypothetical protein H6687_02870 [Bacillales bacterium]|nr:hypothetical protein [Bacillales bacterium]